MPSILAVKDAARALAYAGKSRSEIMAAIDCHWAIAGEGLRWAKKKKAQEYLALRGAFGEGGGDTAGLSAAPELQP